MKYKIFLLLAGLSFVLPLSSMGQPPAITYPNPSILSIGRAIRLTPVAENGQFLIGVTFSISPSLSAGLSFNSSIGHIFGTPTALSPLTVYTVTATNSTGSVITTLSIEVLSALSRPSQHQNYIVAYTPRMPLLDSESLHSKEANEVQQTIRYFDGLGRDLQTVQTKANGAADKDIVIPFAYDGWGREVTSFLPYSSAGATGGFRSNAVTEQLSFYDPGTVMPGVVRTSQPFEQKFVELSPLDRPLEMGSAGSVWQPGAHSQRISYMLNDNIGFDENNNRGSRKVAYFTVLINSDGSRVLNRVNGTATYNDGELKVTVLKDENWQPGDGCSGTVEEYKDKEDRVVLKRTYNSNATQLEMLSTYYVYDDFGNLSFVLPPGINPDRNAGVPTLAELGNFGYRYRYDGRNRMVEKQLPGKGVEYIVCNELDQPILTQDAIQRTTGQWLFSKYDAFGRTVMSGRVTLSGTRQDIQNAANALGVLWETADNSNALTGYRNETETFPTTGIDQYLMINYYDNYEIPGLPTAYKPAVYSTMTKGLPTASKINVLGTTVMLWNVSHYDDKGQVVRQFNQHYKGAVVSESNFDDLTNEYSFTGQLEKSIREHYTGSATIPAVTVITEQTYDHMDRPLDTWTKVDNGTRTLIVRNGYNEIGQTISKQLHSTDNGITFLNTESYAYSPRGWLKSQSGSRFALELKYEDGTNPQYNGNISNQYWGTASNPILHNYSYLYDKLNRLTNGTSDEGFNELINYDKMGNITSLNRNPMGVNTYSYNGNRLTGISGAINGNYAYDANGNQISDSHKGVILDYNYLNLPETISKASTSETMTNTWLATGTKIRKTVGGMTREYVGGIEYNGGIIEFIQTEEGRAIPNGSSGYRYEYMLKDHLGNTRVLLEEDGTVLETSDYYPFGLQVARGQTVISPENRYKYNGKELQTELGLGQYDYGARFYDPVVGRWNVVDPLAEKTSGWTPYAYGANNPILMIDPDGRYSVAVHYRITYNALFKLGYSREAAARVAHYASVYADHPSSAISRIDNITQGTGYGYRPGIDYSPTAQSQTESKSHWHSMMSNAEAASGMTHGQAMQRGLSFGWSNIFAQQRGEDIGKLGQGLHALQDAYGHQGASTSEHIGPNMSSAKMFWNDMYGNTSKADLISQSAVAVVGLFNGNTEGLSSGMRMDFSGMSKKQLGTVTGLLNKAGYELKAEKNKGFYLLREREEEEE